MTPNPQQQVVINHRDGPCMVVAVPGSGKTATVTERIKTLVASGIDPRSILAITFTNKAADEMRKRVGQAVGPEKSSLMTLSTFHSLCARIIRVHAPLVGLTQGYTIYDDDDSERAIKACIRKLEGFGNEGQPPIPKPYLASVKAYLEGSRNDCLSDGQAIKKYPLHGRQKSVVDLYFATLKRSNAIDFTGLLSETLRLFQEHPDVKDRYATRFKYISVDEWQDTNVAQYEMVKLLSGTDKNVLVCGDLDQSIYGWRGAQPENVMRFENDFQGCKTYHLETNYRSTPSILKTSQKLIDLNTMRKPTTLRTDNPDGEKPRLIEAYSDWDMARMIARDTASKIRSGFLPEEIAILYRTNWSSRVLEQAFREAEIKYKVVNGTSFWSRQEVKTGIAMLKLLANENDKMSFERAVEGCCRGAGPKALGAVEEISQGKGIPVLVAAEEFCGSSLYQAKALLPLVAGLRSHRGLLPGKTIMEIAKNTALWSRLEGDSTTVNDRCGNFTELARDVDEYCAKPNSTLAGYLQSLSLLADGDQKSVKGAVKLMTMHSCKGLEFDCVYVSHCTDDVLPHPRAVMMDVGQPFPAQREEERRLLYVSMTRARKWLSLCTFAAKGRAEKMTNVNPSPFLAEIGFFPRIRASFDE